MWRATFFFLWSGKEEEEGKISQAHALSNETISQWVSRLKASTTFNSIKLETNPLTRVIRAHGRSKLPQSFNVSLDWDYPKIIPVHLLSYLKRRGTSKSTEFLCYRTRGYMSANGCFCSNCAGEWEGWAVRREKTTAGPSVSKPRVYNQGRAGHRHDDSVGCSHTV